MSEKARTIGAIADVVAQCSIEGKSFVVGETANGDWVYVQVQYTENCVVKGTPEVQKGRKWHISRFATDSEIAQTCLKAAITSAEHQVREDFTYKGHAIFGPHMDVDFLVDAFTVAAEEGGDLSDARQHMEEELEIAHNGQQGFPDGK